jgi:hypothetical protein
MGFYAIAVLSRNADCQRVYGWHRINVMCCECNISHGLLHSKAFSWCVRLSSDVPQMLALCLADPQLFLSWCWDKHSSHQTMCILISMAAGFQRVDLDVRQPECAMGFQVTRCGHPPAFSTHTQTQMKCKAASIHT